MKDGIKGCASCDRGEDITTTYFCVANSVFNVHQCCMACKALVRDPENALECDMAHPLERRSR